MGSSVKHALNDRLYLVLAEPTASGLTDFPVHSVYFPA